MNMIKSTFGLLASLCIISTLQAAEATRSKTAKKSFEQALTQTIKKKKKPTKKTKAQLETEVTQLKQSLHDLDTNYQAEVKDLIDELEQTKQELVDYQDEFVATMGDMDKHIEKLKIKLAGAKGDAQLLSEDVVTLAKKVNKKTKEKAALLERTEKRHTEIESLYKKQLAQTEVALATERAKNAALEAELKRRTDIMKSPVQSMYA